MKPTSSSPATVKRLVITIEGFDDGDLETALEVVEHAVAEGYLSGFDRNDTGAYHFYITEGERTLSWGGDRP
jgi:hypothetical protein